MSSIMRARSGLTGRLERLESIGGFLSRAEGCWTFDARDRMPRSSPPTAHRLARSSQAVTRALPRERVRSLPRFGHSPRISAGAPATELQWVDLDQSPRKPLHSIVNLH